MRAILFLFIIVFFGKAGYCQTDNIYTEKQVKINQPEFANTIIFNNGDSVLYLECYNTKNKDRPINYERLNYLKSVDSCNLYMVYEVGESFHAYTILQEHNKKHIATYERINSSTWLKTQEGQKIKMKENRKQITSRDTLSITDPLKFETIVIARDYYMVSEE